MAQTNKDYFTEMVKLVSMLGVVAIVLVAVVIWLKSIINAEQPLDPAQVAQANERLKDIEVVAIKGKNQAAAVNTETAASTSTETTASADTGSIDGKAIVTSTCTACHGTGILMSPKIGDKAAWQPRLDANGGIDGLVKSAIAGKGAMPPKGGAMHLSDAELKAAIEYMMQ